jgi:hypothetical protein
MGLPALGKSSPHDCAELFKLHRHMMKRSLSVIFTGFALATIASAAAAAPATPTPYQIFARAKQYWETQRYPEMLEYTVAVTVVEGGKTKIERYRGGYNSSKGAILFDPVSDYEAAHPYVPKGIDFYIPIVHLGKPEPPVDYLGVPDIAPNYGFGIGTTSLTPVASTPTPEELVREIRAEFNDPDPRATPTPLPTPGLREIATVISKTKAYDITLEGIDDTERGQAYHLHMRPLREPGKYRLRDLWVDTSTFAPRKLIEGLNFVAGPGTTVPWSVSFEPIDGSLYIDREMALAPMHYRGLIYTQATVTLADLHVVSMFDDSLSSFQPCTKQLLCLMMQEP